MGGLVVHRFCAWVSHTLSIHLSYEQSYRTWHRAAIYYYTATYSTVSKHILHPFSESLQASVLHPLAQTQYKIQTIAGAGVAVCCTVCPHATNCSILEYSRQSQPISTQDEVITATTTYVTSLPFLQQRSPHWCGCCRHRHEDTTASPTRSDGRTCNCNNVHTGSRCI